MKTLALLFSVASMAFVIGLPAETVMSIPLWVRIPWLLAIAAGVAFWLGLFARRQSVKL